MDVLSLFLGEFVSFVGSVTCTIIDSGKVSGTVVCCVFGTTNDSRRVCCMIISDSAIVSATTPHDSRRVSGVTCDSGTLSSSVHSPDSSPMLMPIPSPPSYFVFKVFQNHGFSRSYDEKK